MREHLLFTFKFNLGHLESLVKDLDDEQMVQQPHGVVNHPAWTLCHLASAANHTGVALGLESTFPEDWEAAAKTGGVPGADASQYPSKDALLAELKKQHERVAAAVAAADPAVFAKEYPDERMRKHFPTMGDFVDYLLSAHEANHIGQLAAWRRAMASENTGVTTATIERRTSGLDAVVELLGDDAALLEHRCRTIPASDLHLPGPDFVDRCCALSDRPARVLTSLQALFSAGRLAGTGYVSILPVDQGIEHSAGASFAPNPACFDPENVVRLAIEGGCNAVASTLGVLGALSRRYAHKIPFILKLNHNEFISYPNTYDQIRFASVEQAFDMGAMGVGATVYFGSDESRRQLQEVSEAFHQAHELGMFTVLWCYLRNPAFKTADADYHTAADLTGQANHLGVTIEADVIKQKLPETNRGYPALGFGKTHGRVYDALTTDHPIDLTRYQVANCYLGRAGLINSGGASSGESDLKEAVKTAVINKRAGGTGLISGRKAFQRPMAEGVALLNAIQDVYLSPDVTIA